jgi:hypothetical protein
MSNVTKSVYLKFRIDEGPIKTMDAFIVSEDKDREDRWRADEPPEEAHPAVPG